MKPLQFWTTVLGLVISLLVLGGYAYGISAYAATLGEKVETLRFLRGEDKKSIKDDIDYIKHRVDEIYNRLPPCGQCEVR